MVFSSFMFIWVFFPIVFVGNRLCWRIGGNKAANILLLAASVFFYAWGEPSYVILMLLSITVNWAAGLLMQWKHNRLALAVAVIINLGLLGYYKYAGMLTQTVNKLFGVSLAVPQIPLPIGISFFTFQALSYVIDVYRGECETQRSWFKMALYISFFPQLIAGPIVKYRDISEQINDRIPTMEKTAEGIRRFIYGFGKKILLANVFALYADRIYAMGLAQVTGAMAWRAALAYTMQIYYDFSGYSDMAIGMGKIFGFDFQENFRYPYLSLSIREFWRRWHISLSSWFRDYLYIPLGGSRKGVARTYLNLMIVFFCTGFWHGASWNFVLWGLFHGLFSIIERLGLDKILKKVKPLAFLYTMLVVIFGWVLFRMENLGDAGRYFLRMLLPWHYTTSTYGLQDFLDGYTLMSMVLGVLGAGAVQRAGEKMGLTRRWRGSVPEIIYCMLVLILSLISLASNTYNPFIYFRF